MQWEYKVVNSKLKTKGFFVPEPDVNSFEANLNELGRQNWELVSCSAPTTSTWAGGSSHIQAVLKRPR
ncbi:DUF4177 domain-containing protein [Paraglaciecola arctica]|uniref:DUF4177 domain-containing protein n=1 Tax=Paraglaciecola arctica TaxID=1128911 RepID=UPI0005872C48